MYNNKESLKSMKDNRINKMFQKFANSMKRFFHLGHVYHVFFLVFCLLQAGVNFSASLIPTASSANRPLAFARELSSLNVSSEMTPTGRATLASRTNNFRATDISASVVKSLQKANDSLEIFKVYVNDTQPSSLRFEVAGDSQSAVVCDTTLNDANVDDLRFYSGISLLSGKLTYLPSIDDVYVSSKYADEYIAQKGLASDYSLLVGVPLAVNTYWFSQLTTRTFIIRGVFDASCVSFTKLFKQYSDVFVMRMEGSLSVRPSLYFETVSSPAYNASFFESFFKTCLTNDSNSYYHFSFSFFSSGHYSTNQTMIRFIEAAENSYTSQVQLFYYLIFLLVYILFLLGEILFYVLYLKKYPCCYRQIKYYWISIFVSSALSLLFFLFFPSRPILVQYIVPSFTPINLLFFVGSFLLSSTVVSITFLRKRKKDNL